MSRGTYSAINDLKPDFTFMVSPVDDSYMLRKNIEVVSLSDLIIRIESTI
jgi:hypothetical protein